MPNKLSVAIRFVLLINAAFHRLQILPIQNPSSDSYRIRPKCSAGAPSEEKSLNFSLKNA